MKPLVFPNRNAWLKARCASVGASELRILYGLGYANESIASLKAAKQGLRDTPDKATQRKFDIATTLEPTVVKLFTNESKVKVKKRRSKVELFRLGLLSATPDFITRDDPKPTPVEIKCVNASDAREWSGDSAPLRVQCQVQQQMYCMGAEHGYACALIGNHDFRWFHVERNDDFIEDMVRRVESFWSRFIINDDPPPLTDASPHAISKAIALLYPEDNGFAINLPAIAAELSTVARFAKDQVAKWDHVAQECDNVLRLMIGENTFGVLPSGDVMSLKTVKVKPSRCECGATTRNGYSFRKLNTNAKGNPDVIEHTINPAIVDDARRIIDTTTIDGSVVGNGTGADEQS